MGAVCVSASCREVYCLFSPSVAALEMLLQQKVIGPALCGIEAWSHSVEDACIYVIAYVYLCVWGDS